jgi:hypothetical protein
MLQNDHLTHDGTSQTKPEKEPTAEGLGAVGSVPGGNTPTDALAAPADGHHQSNGRANGWTKRGCPGNQGFFWGAALGKRENHTARRAESSPICEFISILQRADFAFEIRITRRTSLVRFAPVCLA